MRSLEKCPVGGDHILWCPETHLKSVGEHNWYCCQCQNFCQSSSSTATWNTLIVNLSLMSTNSNKVFIASAILAFTEKFYYLRAFFK